MVIQFQFKDRAKELSELRASLDAPGFGLIVIYGRRRIGKTELVLQATSGHRRLYYLATGERDLERFAALCASHYPDAAKLRPDWEMLFEFLSSHADVVVIDEFQNMIKRGESGGAILNTFQSIVDVVLKGSPLKLVLLGSSVSIMTSKLLSHKSPLYGRRTSSSELGPVSFFDLSKFFPGASAKELVETYGFADGIPFYLVKLSKPLWLWIEEELGKGNTFLRDEIDFLMKYEFDDAGTYKQVLEAIAHGNTKVNEIKDHIGAKRTDLSPYLRNLIEVKMVKREVPITETPNSRMGRYYLSDNFLKFWFRYIYPNMSAIQEGLFDVSSIKKDYNTYLGRIFEDVARQYIIKNRKAVFDATKIGRWWYKESEIDLVAMDERTDEILFIECKWQDGVNAKAAIDALRKKAGEVDWRRKKRKERYAIFARSFGQKAQGEDVLHFTLGDIEKSL